MAAVSRLLWRVFRDRWPDTGRLVTLVEDDTRIRSLGPIAAHSKVTYALAIAAVTAVAMAVTWWNDGAAYFATVTDATVTGVHPSHTRT